MGGKRASTAAYHVTQAMLVTDIQGEVSVARERGPQILEPKKISRDKY